MVEGPSNIAVKGHEAVAGDGLLEAISHAGVLLDGAEVGSEDGTDVDELGSRPWWPQAMVLVLGAWGRFDGPRAPCDITTAANVWWQEQEQQQSTCHEKQ